MKLMKKMKDREVPEEVNEEAKRSLL